MHWNHGYNTDLGYTFGYYREQDPAWLDLSALFKGACPPSQSATGRLRYLELGCGQGLNLCLIAACHPGMDFVGIDFNPAHIAHAQGLARAAGLGNVRFVEGDFAELGKNWPDSLGRFHYATAHGILSWIARPVREGLYRCLDAALEPGALVYLSYNTLPGWLAGLPIQHLLRLWQVSEGWASLTAIEQGCLRLQRLTEANAATSKALPAMKARLDKLASLDRSYLVNEYMHESWTTFWFDELAKELAPHKLQYLTTATASDWYLPAMLPAEWKAVLQETSDAVARETVLDVLINQSFRRDLWVRGQAPLWPARQREVLLGLRFALLSRPTPKEAGAHPYVYGTSLGEVNGKPEVYGPLYDALQSGPKTLGELMQVPLIAADGQGGVAARTLGDTLQAVGLMLAAGHVALARGALSGAADKAAKALNRAIAQASLDGAPYRSAVASALPWVLGATDSELMLAALHLSQPKAEADRLAQVWVDRLLLLGRGLAHEGQALTTREAMLPRATALVQAFQAQTWPTWQRLGVL